VQSESIIAREAARDENLRCIFETTRSERFTLSEHHFLGLNGPKLRDLVEMIARHSSSPGITSGFASKGSRVRHRSSMQIAIQPLAALRICQT